MIYDKLCNIKNYANVLPNVIDLVEKFIASIDENTPKGRQQLDGDMVMADLSCYKTAPVSKGRIENHHRYIDIQVVLKGDEDVYFSGCDELELLEDAYDEKDCGFYGYKSEISYSVPLVADTFMIIVPGEGHMPGRGEQEKDICKIVFKIDKSLWSK